MSKQGAFGSFLQPATFLQTPPPPSLGLFATTDAKKEPNSKDADNNEKEETGEVKTGPPVFNFAKPSHLSSSSQGKYRTQANRNSLKDLEVQSRAGFFSVLLESPWRNVTWTKEARQELLGMVKSYTPATERVSEARVLLLGPVGAGKSSFISSVQSVFSGRVLNRAMVGSSTSKSFTKKLQNFNIKLERTSRSSTSLVLCDVMGFGEGDTTGLSLCDALSIIKGHVPEGHQFSLCQPVGPETEGFIKKPSLNDKMHCVVFVVDASKLMTYPKGVGTMFQQLREHISNLGVHQVALLTHMDQVCKETARDVTQVYKSKTVQDMIERAGTLLGMATSYIVPVKNYSSQLEVDEHTDILLLTAVDHILQYADLYFQDGTSSE